MGNIPIYSTPEINYPEVKETAGSGFYNIKYSNLNIDYNRSDLKIFKDQYISRNNREPSLDSVLGYNAMIFLSNCLSYTKENLLKCLSEVKINGMTGPLSISNNRVDYSESMVINEIK